MRPDESASRLKEAYAHCSLSNVVCMQQKLRSEELQKIVAADQTDRTSPIDWDKVNAADEIRQKRVGEIFGEGCFKEAKDYAAAALVFIHGSTPDHYYQAYLWSKKAIELGEPSQRQLMANAIDRYLINIGHKQIFGGQYFRTEPDKCLCLAPVEKSFPDEKRIEVCGLTLEQRMEYLRKDNKDRPECDAVVYCDKKLLDSPKGIFPGVW